MSFAGHEGMTAGGRIHITGASGAGVSTLGRAVAVRLGIPHFDTDDFYWLPSDPPYRHRRAPAERLERLSAMLAASPGQWVLSGSLDTWGEPLKTLFDRVVFLSTPTEIRLRRLGKRERARFGAEALAPGGVMHAQHKAFMEWAAAYDSGWMSGRSRPRHEGWLATLDCMVLRLDGTRPVPELVEAALRPERRRFPRNAEIRAV